jgi:hypothetical protein
MIRFLLVNVLYKPIQIEVNTQVLNGKNDGIGLYNCKINAIGRNLRIGF